MTHSTHTAGPQQLPLLPGQGITPSCGCIVLKEQSLNDVRGCLSHTVVVEGGQVEEGHDATLRMCVKTCGNMRELIGDIILCFGPISGLGRFINELVSSFLMEDSI